MSRVFVYEFLTAGGCWSLGDEPPSGSLLAEGRAMRDALARDFAVLPNVGSVQVLHDDRLSPPVFDKLELHPVRSTGEEVDQLQQLASTADATIVIAPEFSDLLLQRVLLAEQVKARLISPGSELVRLTADKTLAVDHLAANGIRVPSGIRFSNELPQPIEVDFPAVLKPNDGAGSTNVQWINSLDELRQVDFRRAECWRLERFLSGTPASVAMIAGPNGIVPLQPCSQHLSKNGRFTYLGGSTPLPVPLSQRAKRLAVDVANSLPSPRGYLGIDMVLGSAENGSEDFVIEINPRLTTSYLGLRQSCEQNLAESIWKCARGETVSLTFHNQKIEFTPC